MRVTTRGEPLVQWTRTGLWLAEDERGGRSVAVRQALPGVAATADVRRELAREARVLSLLGPHEAVLTLLVDASDEDPPRLLLEGGDLATVSARLGSSERGVELAVALGIVLPLAEALAAAHARSIVHSALGPDVVLLTDRGTPKLTLWASALAPSVEPPPSVDELRDPAWIAPEVRMGEEPRPTADVFALGSLLALLLRGRSTNAPGAAASPTPRDLRARLAETAPDAVAKVIARATAKSPADRHETAASFLAALLDAAPPPDRRAVGAVLARRPGGRRGREPAEAEPSTSRGGLAAAPFVAVLGGLALWAGVVELARDEPVATGANATTASIGYLRILAFPWAAVSLDGEPLDTTPIGAPVGVRPGRHVLDFVHPRAPKVQRVVEVLPGQTVVVDVILDLPSAPEVDAGPESP